MPRKPAGFGSPANWAAGGLLEITQHCWRGPAQPHRDGGVSVSTLEIRDLTIEFGRGRSAVTAVDLVNLDISDGGILGLVGESGSGKSTLARAVVGLVPVQSGQVLVDGVDLTTLKGARRRRERRRV